ncbi:hypothetical protein J6590_095695 [Homalodisca vitripennis]|nr:hypothetical protein J6590_095695 [Homalodisca vitripennis]
MIHQLAAGSADVRLPSCTPASCHTIRQCSYRQLQAGTGLLSARHTSTDLQAGIGLLSARHTSTDVRLLSCTPASCHTMFLQLAAGRYWVDVCSSHEYGCPPALMHTG